MMKKRWLALLPLSGKRWLALLPLSGKRWLALLPLVAAGLAACGQSSPSSTPVLSAVPVAPGTRVVADTRRCDRGANPYCAVQLVLVGDHDRSSVHLLNREASHLKSLGWTVSNGDTGLESASDSPGHKLRLTYATAADDLEGLDLGWIRRSPKITMTLSRVMFDRRSALSLMLETGSS
jgi:hypothetical protein